MTEQNLTERLNFERDNVLLDGEVIFSVPHRPAVSGINLLGVPQHGRRIYIGSGQCCYGLITILDDIAGEGETPKFQLDGFRVPDFNAYDIIPAHADYKKTGFANEGAILTAGYGCAGSGVRLIDTYYPKTIEVVSGEEFQEMWDSRIQKRLMPRINVNEHRGIITLDLLQSSSIAQDIWASKDLTPVLNDLGVDVEKTIEANREYTRIRH